MRKFLNLNENTVWSLEDLKQLQVDMKNAGANIEDDFESFIEDLESAGDFEELK